MLHNRNIIVTGCNSPKGMGWATAIACGEGSANVVCPGAIRTELAEAGIRTTMKQTGLSEAEVDQMSARRSALGRWASASEPAELIAFLISDKASFVTGSVIEAGGGVIQGL